MQKFIRCALVAAFTFSAPFVHAQASQPASAAAPAPAQAAPAVVPPDQQPTKEQLDKLFDVMHIREQSATVMRTLPVMVQQQMRQQEKEMTGKLAGGEALTPEQQAALDKIMSRFAEKSTSLYPIDEMLGDMAAIYQRHFTRDDVNAYIAFYSTPAGEHLLALTPIIMQEYMPVLMQRAQERSKGLMAEMSKEIAGVLQPAPATSTPATPAAH